MPPKLAHAVTATINGSTLVFSRRNGALLSLVEPEGNRLIDTTAELGGLIDVACPLKKFGPFRLASRFSRGCQIETGAGRVMVRYGNLGGSRDDVAWKGRVSAVVTISAHADGRSLIFEAAVTNHSASLLPQVLFPDFPGLVPAADLATTWFRQGGVKLRPFLELNEAGNHGVNQLWRGTWWDFFEPGNGWWGGTSLGRWSHFGSKQAGLGIFDEGWHPDPEHAVLVRVPEDEPRRARVCFTRELTKWLQLDGHIRTAPGEGVAPGATWRSAPFVVTPHAGTWPVGIETYRSHVRGHRCATVPQHVREALGFRTVFMFEMQEFNPRRSHFRWKDLPRLARESRSLGIRELNVWGGIEPFKLPLRLPRVLGSRAEFARALRECRRLGVNVSLMLSINTLDAKTGLRFGTGGKTDAGWSYHTEAIPPINPGYYTSYAGHGVNPSNRKWQSAVLRGIRGLLRIAPFSICWDQYVAGQKDRSIDELARKILEESRRTNPLATFSGESTTTLEAESEVLHYTWNWRSDVLLLFRTAHRNPDYAAPALSVWRAPRLNLNVETDPVRITKGFIDNFYLNFLVRKRNGIWGSGEFSDHPDLCALLRRLAALRRRYQVFFTDGVLLGDGFVREEIEGIHTSAFRHGNQVLLFVLDDRAKGPTKIVKLSADVRRWLPLALDSLRIEKFSITGRANIRNGPRGNGLELTLRDLVPGELRGFLIG
ncbi:MAG: hypothetical protein JWM35_1223 [Verrucomicrobia bacterium]|nr:hypothetical protein [Verrucomicrobiota bacterium]